MDKEEALYQLQIGVDLIKLMTWEQGGVGNYTPSQVQDICNKWKELYEYVKENLK